MNVNRDTLSAAFYEILIDTSKFPNASAQVQRAFKGQMQNDYGLAPTKQDFKEHPKLDPRSRWDIVTGSFTFIHQLAAAHIFPYKTGPHTMKILFGEGTEKELFSSLNGLLAPSNVEKKIDRGMIVIVPDLPVGASQEQFEQWHLSDPKEYVFRTLDNCFHDQDGIPVAYKKEFKMRLDSLAYTKTAYGDGAVTFKDLDGKRLHWRNSFRPHPKYLYYLYCLNVLSFVWGHRQEAGILSKQLGKGYWGRPGRYIKESMVRCLIKEVGHDLAGFLGDCEVDGEEDESIGGHIADHDVV